MSTAPRHPRVEALRRALRLEQVSIVWMIAEGGIAVASGIAAGSLALAAFGWDSLIETITALAVLWRVVVEARAWQGAAEPTPPATAGRGDAAERIAARVVAAGLMALALYILAGAIEDFRGHRVARPGLWGLGVSAVAVVGMPALYAAKRRVARLLESEALAEDAVGNLTCGLMAGILLAGLIAQRGGIWWADPAAALLLGLFVAREGWEAWKRARGGPAPAIRVFLGLGSNLGDRFEMLSRARADLAAPDLRVVAASRVYETLPWGDADQPPYLNQVVEAQTTLSPRALLARCHEIEARLGRVRSRRWGPRTIDVDILVYGTAEIAESDLVIPHPELRRRAFVLVPLAELDPDLRLPDGETAAGLLEALPGRGGVREYAPSASSAAGGDR